MREDGSQVGEREQRATEPGCEKARALGFSGDGFSKQPANVHLAILDFCEAEIAVRAEVYFQIMGKSQTLGMAFQADPLLRSARCRAVERFGDSEQRPEGPPPAGSRSEELRATDSVIQREFPMNASIKPGRAGSGWPADRGDPASRGFPE